MKRPVSPSRICCETTRTRENYSRSIFSPVSYSRRQYGWVAFFACLIVQGIAGMVLEGASIWNHDRVLCEERSFERWINGRSILFS